MSVCIQSTCVELHLHFFRVLLPVSACFLLVIVPRAVLHHMGGRSHVDCETSSQKRQARLVSTATV